MAGFDSGLWRRMAVGAVPVALFALLLGAVEWRFAPYVDVLAFDTRVLGGFHRNIIDEVNQAQSGQDGLPRCLSEIAGAPPSDRHPCHYHNILPPLLLRGVGSVLELVLAYNLLTLLAWALACACTYALSRQLGASRLGAVAAGALFGLSPPVWFVMRYDSLDYKMMFWLPLFALTLLRARQPGNGRWVVAAGLTMLGLGATNYYYLMGAAALGLALAADTLVPGKGPGAAHRGLRPLRNLVLAGLLGSALLAPQLRAEVAAQQQAHRRVDQQQTVARMGGYADLGDALRGLRLSTPWSVALAALLAPALLRRRGRGHWRDRLLLGGVGLLMLACLLLYMTNVRSLAPWLASSTVLWRLQRLHMALALPLVLLAAVAGQGLSAALDSLRRPRVRQLATAAVVAVGVSLGSWSAGSLDRYARSHPAFDAPPGLRRLLRSTRQSSGLAVFYRPVGQDPLAELWQHLPEIYGHQVIDPEDWRYLALSRRLDPDSAPRPPRHGVDSEWDGTVTELAQRCHLVLVKFDQRAAAGQDTLSPRHLMQRMGLVKVWGGEGWLAAHHPWCDKGRLSLR